MSKRVHNVLLRKDHLEQGVDLMLLEIEIIFAFERWGFARMKNRSVVIDKIVCVVTRD